jgi:hypothetical protein
MQNNTTADGRLWQMAQHTKHFNLGTAPGRPIRKDGEGGKGGEEEAGAASGQAQIGWDPFYCTVSGPLSKQIPSYQPIPSMSLSSHFPF